MSRQTTLTHGSTVCMFPSEDTLLIFNIACSVKDYSRISHLERSSSTHPTLPSQSSSRSIENLHNDNETLFISCPLTAVTFQDAHKFLANGWKMLQEWNRHWGMGASFSLRAANAFLGIGLVEVTADRAHGEILDIIRKGKEVLFQLESIAASINLCSIQDKELRSFWLETVCVIEGVNEQVTRADVARQYCTKRLH